MLNRTIRTLSANQNRLILGTRSFALIQGGNMDLKSRRIRLAHPFVTVEPARAGTSPAVRYPSPLGAERPSVPDSPPATARPAPGRAAQPWCGLVEPSQPASKPVVVTDRPCLVGPARGRRRTVSSRVGTRVRTAPVAARRGLATEG
jgi:hypothetical protein